MGKSNKEIGKKLKVAREKLELTQAEVAKKVGLHVNSYAKLERGEVAVSIKTLGKIAKALNIKFSDILPF